MKKSFTLVELLVIVGIFILLIAISFPAIRFFQKESDLNNSTEEVINTLRLAQSKALASEGASQWGVYFSTSTTPHQYTLFQGENYSSRVTSSDEIYKLPLSVEFSDINLAGGQEVVFDRIVGSTSQSGNLSLKLKTDPTKNRTIYIESSGQVGLTPPSVPSDEERIKDSRHVHFDLGWSIQNATTLKFNFVNVGQIETVDMANYFNADKTAFNWEGKFLVAEVNQVFHVHTHSLDAFNTILCLHRDRNNGQSNQEVIIYIIDEGIDKDIAHYLADATDTVEKGSYVNTMERQ